MRGLRDCFAARRAMIEEAIRRIVEIESPSGDVVGSRRVVEALTQAAQDIAAVVSVERVESEGVGTHLVITAVAATDEDARDTGILLLGHTDTVHARGSLAARPFRVEDDRIFAPGIFDMKANCVIALEALRALAESGARPRRAVRMLLTCDEETGSATGRALVEREARGAAAALVIEPSAAGGAAKTARKGTGTWTLRARGRAAHAGLNPRDGASAILELARQTERFHAMSDFATGTTFNVGTLNGGTRSNVVAEEATAELDVRFSTMREAERVAELLNNLAPFDGRVGLMIDGDINRPPLERTGDVLRLYEQARSIAAMLDFELDETSVGGASDGNFVGALGIPVLDGLGLQGDGAHAAHEHILRSDIPFRAALLAGLLLSL